jgi:hypothetical protein
MINELRFGYQAVDIFFDRPDRIQGPAILPNTYTNPIYPGFASGRRSPVFELTENLIWQRGKHTLKTGMVMRRTTQFSSSDANIYPNVYLTLEFGVAPPANVGPTTGISSADRQRFQALYNDLLGTPSFITRTFYSDLETYQPPGTPRVRNTRLYDWGAFLQDDWRVRRNLVLNLGLRWEVFASPRELNDVQGALDRIELINPVSQISDLKIVRQPSWYRTSYTNFAPRFGFAWDIFGNGRTSLRGGYGLFYDRPIGATAALADAYTTGFSEAVWSVAGTAFPVGTRVSQNLPMPQQPAAPQLQPPVTRQALLIAFQPELRTGYVQQFNVNLQRELFRGTVADVGWVRNAGIGLFTWLDMNQLRIYEDFLKAFLEIDAFRISGAAVPASNSLVRLFGSPQAAVSGIGVTAFQQGAAGAAAETIDYVPANFNRYPQAGLSPFYIRNFPQFNMLPLGTNNGRLWYDSLQASLRRVSGSLRFAVNYSFSKTLDNLSVDGDNFSAPIDNFNLNLNKGRGDYDRTHVVNWMAAYSLPFGKGKQFFSDAPRWLDAAVGGWEIGSIGICQSGPVFSVTSGRRTGPSTLNSRADYAGDRTIGAVDRRGNGVWFWNAQDIARFSFPRAGELGTSGRNSFRGPGYFSFDTSLVKRFALPWEGHTAVFRAEVYNTLNRTNFNAPSASLLTPQSLGRISSTLSSRIWQLALRYEF